MLREMKVLGQWACLFLLPIFGYADGVTTLRMYLASDGTPDTNLDGVPDVYVTQYSLADSFDGPNIGSDNTDEDYFPVKSNPYSSLIPSIPSFGLDPFTTKLEIRGYGDALNDAPVLAGIVDVVPNRVYTDPALDSNSTLSPLEYMAWTDYTNEHTTATIDDWSPERPSDPTKPDTDGDGIDDGTEYWWWYRAHVGYLDADGNHCYATGRRYSVSMWPNGETITPLQIKATMDPLVAIDASSSDADGDGLPDLFEIQIGTNPFDFDTDGDGLPDGYEILVTASDPLRSCTNPALLDTDTVGVSDVCCDWDGQAHELITVNANANLTLMFAESATGPFSTVKPSYVKPGIYTNWCYGVYQRNVVGGEVSSAVCGPVHVGIVEIQIGDGPLPDGSYARIIDGYTWLFYVSDRRVSIGAYTSDGTPDLKTAVSPLPSGNFAIPNKICGMPVVSIGYRAFYDCYGLTSVSIPSSVTNIGVSAFSGCSGLTRVDIDDLAAWCRIKFGNGGSPLYYAKHLCLNGEEVKDLIIPNEVTSIGDYAFCGCKGLASVTIPSSVTSIEKEAFYGCSSLTSVTISSGVTSIGADAFICENLRDIVVAADNPNYKSVNDCLLSKDGTSLIRGPSKASVTIPSSVTRIEGGAFECCTGLVSVTIPSSVKSIEYGAFRGCSGLASVTIPSSVSSVYKSVFYGCSGLISVTIQEGVTSIEENAFYGCSALSSVTIPLSVTRIDSSAFRGCTGLTTLTIPSSVTGIGNYAFYNCSGLTSVTIPSSVTSIGSSAFYGCNSLKTIYVDVGGANRAKTLLKGSGFDVSALSFVENLNGGPYTKSVNGITWTYIVNNGEAQLGTGTYSGQTISTTTKGAITIPSTLGDYPVTSIGNYAFYKCDSLTSVTIPSSVTRIGDDAFYNCDSLTSVTIPSSVTRIGNSAFSQCSGLTEVTIPSSVMSVCRQTFAGCSGLTSVTISDGVTSIGYDAFYNCSGLTSVTIPSSVTSIGESPFCYCSGLMSISVDPENPEFCAINGLLCSKDGKTLIAGVNGDVTIPSSVTSIREYAFQGCKGLTSVSLPSSVTYIGNYAFAGCSGLISVTNLSSVTSIGWEAFQGCSGLTSVTISEGVTSIGKGAFVYCSGLKSFSVAANNPFYSSRNGLLCSKDGSTVLAGVNGDVVIPEGVTSIGYGAFTGCSGLTSVMISSSVTNIGDCAFTACSGLTSVTIPEGVTRIGDSTFSVCSRLTSVTIPSSVTSIGACAFADCSELTSVTIPEGVTRIVDLTFSGCSRLTSVIIPSSVTSIGYDAFRGCCGLTSVTIPTCVRNLSTPFPDAYVKIENVVIQEGVTSIPSRMFENCSGLTSVTIPSSMRTINKNAFYDCSGLKTIYVSGNGDIDVIKQLVSQSGFDVTGVSFRRVETLAMPVIEGDEGATVTGDVETGFVVKPSEEKTAVEVTIPHGVDSAKVTIEISPKVVSVKPNGAKVKVVSGGADITEFLYVPSADVNGVVDIAKAMVKEEIVKEAMDVEHGAAIELNALNPSLTTPNTRKGLVYKLREGTTLEGMQDGDSTVGNGQPWTPTITVKGGTSGFYTISVEK